MRRDPRLISIVLWYCIFMILFVGTAQFVPIHPKLKIPRIFFTHAASANEAFDQSICLVGDSAVFGCPWPYIKRTCPGADVDMLIDILKANPLPPACESVVIMFAHPERTPTDVEILSAAIRKEYPHISVRSIPTTSFHKISKKHPRSSNNPWHPDKVGYSILHRTYMPPQ